MVHAGRRLLFVVISTHVWPGELWPHDLYPGWPIVTESQFELLLGPGQNRKFSIQAQQCINYLHIFYSSIIYNLKPLVLTLPLYFQIISLNRLHFWSPLFTMDSQSFCISAIWCYAKITDTIPGTNHSLKKLRTAITGPPLLQAFTRARHMLRDDWSENQSSMNQPKLR